jgi:hypothetical protein
VPTSADFDRELVKTGLDSAALTRLGVIVHTEPEPGLYRGTLGRGDLPEASFTVNVTKECAVAQVNIDLAALAGEGKGDCGCGCGGTKQGHAGAGNEFTVHPKGYMVFQVATGAGGFHVNLRRADENPELQAWDTRKGLTEGDIFAAMILRPGVYSLANELTDARGKLRVAYPPQRGKAPYRPPSAFEATCGKAFEPDGIELQSLQGLNVAIRSPARIKIALQEPDDGPHKRA